MNMNTRKVLMTSILALGLGSGAITAAFAESAPTEKDRGEAQALSGAKISIVAAIRAAEQAVGGKAADVHFDLQRGAAIYEISLLMPDGVERTVNVDAASGKVDTADADHDDHDGEDSERS